MRTVIGGVGMVSRVLKMFNIILREIGRLREVNRFRCGFWKDYFVVWIMDWKEFRFIYIKMNKIGFLILSS